MNIIDNHLALHERALNLREKRMGLLSVNVANADTPNFKARDIDFKVAMNNALQKPMLATQENHFTNADGETIQDPKVMYRVPFNAAFDGNTVEYSVEQAKFGKAGADFQASLTFFENRVSSIRKALRGD